MTSLLSSFIPAIAIPILNSVRVFLQGDGAVILPEMELLLFAIGILVIDYWVEEKEKYWNAGLAVAGTIFSTITLWMLHNQILVKGDLLGFSETALVDSYFLFFAILFLAATALIILLSVKYLEIEEERRGSFYAFLLFACIGAMLLVSAIDLTVIFLGIEVMAFSLFALVGFSQESPLPKQAAQKYALTSVFSSGLLAYGFSLLYGVTGSTNIARIAQALGQRIELVHALLLSREHGAPAEHMRELIQQRIPMAMNFDPRFVQFLPLLALILIGIGLAYKLAAVPFHSWAPKAFGSSPVPVSAFAITVPIVAVFALLLRFLVIVFAPLQDRWPHMIAVIAILSIAWTNLAALRQQNLKRLFTYAAISQIGYILLGLVAGNESGFTATTFSLLAYTFTLVGVFGVLTLFHRRYQPGETRDDLNGFFYRNPSAALLFLVFVLSLLAIPGTSGFMSKYLIFKSLLETQHKSLAILSLVCLLPSLIYLPKLLARIWRKPPIGDEVIPLPMGNAEAIALGVALFVCLAAGLYAQPFVRLAHYAFGQ